LKILQDC